MSHRQVSVFRGDSSRFACSVEQVSRVLGGLVLDGARAEVQPTGGGVVVTWQTPDSPWGFQRAELGSGVITVEGDRDLVARIVVALRSLFDSSANDVWVARSGQGMGRLLPAGVSEDEVFDGWGELPIDDFR